MNSERLKEAMAKMTDEERQALAAKMDADLDEYMKKYVTTHIIGILILDHLLPSEWSLPAPSTWTAGVKKTGRKKWKSILFSPSPSKKEPICLLFFKSATSTFGSMSAQLVMSIVFAGHPRS